MVGLGAGTGHTPKLGSELRRSFGSLVGLEKRGGGKGRLTTLSMGGGAQLVQKTRSSEKVFP
jgi:hypothetical protein